MGQGPKFAIRSGVVSGPVPGSHRILSVRSGAASPEAYPVSGPVRCHIPKSVFRAIRSGLVSGLVLLFTDPVSGPSGRRFCVPPDPVQCTIRCSVDLAIFRSQARCPSCHTGCRRGGSLPSMVRLPLRDVRVQITLLITVQSIVQRKVAPGQSNQSFKSLQDPHLPHRSNERALFIAVFAR